MGSAAFQANDAEDAVHFRASEAASMKVLLARVADLDAI